MKIIYLVPIIIVAICMLCVSRQHCIDIWVVYGFWVSGFMFGLGLDEASKKSKASTNNSNN